jgi:uncharacterized repeat protein (TIGR01451 family)
MRRMLIVVTMVILMAIVGGNNLFAQTAAGTAIQNQAVVTAANVSASVQSLLISTNVSQIAGAEYDLNGIPLDQPGASGGTVTLVFAAINEGNCPTDYTFSVVAASTLAGPSTGTNWILTWIGGSTVAGVAMGDPFTNRLQVDIAGDAVDGAQIGWQIEISAAPSAGSFATNIRYDGDQAGVNYYGGDMGIDWDGSVDRPGILVHTNGTEGAGTENEYIQVTVQGPVLGISKSITALDLTGVAMGAKVIPGATITYTIRVSNTGSGFANNVIVRDTRPTSTTLVPNIVTAAAGSETWTGVQIGNNVEYTANYLTNDGVVATLSFDVTID